MRRSDFFRKVTGMILLGFLLSLGFFQPIKEYFHIPQEITLFNSESSTLASSIPASANLDVTDQNIAAASATKDQVQMTGKKTGDTEMTVSVGNVPVKKVDVKVSPDLKLVPGGQSVGVQLSSKGVMVVGFHLIKTQQGEKSPGEKAGIQVGDIITKINGNQIESMSDVKKYVRQSGESGEPLKLTVKRHDKVVKKELQPVKDKQSQKYRIGIYIRDSAAGIGTLTFYDPKSGKYGALGHVISDMDTKEPIVADDGKIVKSEITAIDKGEDGQPGEKIAQIKSDGKAIGNITKNTPFGIYGELNQELKKSQFNKPMPIALPKEVKEGPAKILTVIDGNKIQAFDVKVVNSISQKFPATKGMVIKITDPKLLDKTGGIVQGMSGSPIIQDGKIIGAVTHVFVNDSTQGYGVHIEWMLKEAGIDIYKDDQGRKEAS
ncbi:SpoIVB peptidase [Tuberibacillus sp. Marseille-P3662]|uniref:SpoIVB peptidase n=1 Tax=Tuberibacillus sp. Marseille-P3662 TaxID=1965358 RepID=UPI000A1CE34C|nr:SpoIVB peptidase [Tuberibacillus sp. Marseille-P3662]